MQCQSAVGKGFGVGLIFGHGRSQNFLGWVGFEGFTLFLGVFYAFQAFIRGADEFGEIETGTPKYAHGTLGELPLNLMTVVYV